MLIFRSEFIKTVLFGAVLIFVIAGFAEAVPDGEKLSSVTKAEEEKTFDLDLPPSTTIKIAENVYFGGRLELEFKDEKDLDLDSSEADALTIIRPRVSIATTIKGDENFEGFFSLRYWREKAFEEEGGNDAHRRSELRISQANLLFKDIFERTSLKIGRQRFSDDREWVFDERLDAVRILYELGDLELDGSLSWKGSFDMNLTGNRDDKRIDNYFLRAEWFALGKIKLAPYIIYRNGQSREWSRPLFLGIHSSGAISKRLKYWSEFAWVQGREKNTDGSGGSFDFEGIGFDFGGIYEFDSPMKPAIVAGFAFGSGDSNGGDGKDRGFRQTGLQDNSDRLNGITSVRYYGELFDPELSNMMVFTLGGGVRPHKDLSLEVIYHYYLQHHAANSIRDTNIDAVPTGLSHDLGSEIDFVVGWRFSKKLYLKASFGVFLPGDAFASESDETALYTRIKLRYKF